MSRIQVANEIACELSDHSSRCSYFYVNITEVFDNYCDKYNVPIKGVGRCDQCKKDNEYGLWITIHGESE